MIPASSGSSGKPTFSKYFKKSSGETWARPWFGKIDSTVLQQNVKCLDTAYENFFGGRGFPKLKNRSNFTSFTYQMGVKVQGNKVYLPKLGWMRFFNSR